jgi:hypothetical protein
MTSHHIHSQIAQQRAHELRGAARRETRRTSVWSDVAPAVSVLAGIAGVLALAAPSL